MQERNEGGGRLGKDGKNTGLWVKGLDLSHGLNHLDQSLDPRKGPLLI